MSSYYDLTPDYITKDTFTEDAFAKLKDYPLTIYINVEINNATIALYDYNIIEGSFELRRDGISGNSLEVGTAISSEVKFTIDNNDGAFNSVMFEGATIRPYVIWPKSDTHAYWFALGLFYIDETPRIQRAIKISALDGMVKFDKPYPSTAWPVTATLANILADACTDCGITLITPTDTIIDTILDVFTVAAYPEGDLITYRDIIRWVCGLTFTCARMTHQGYLELTWFNVPNDYNFTDTSEQYALISEDIRFTSDLYENEAKITALSFSYVQDGEPGITEGSIYDPANFDYTLYIKDNMLSNGAGLSILVPSLVFLQRFGDPTDPPYEVDEDSPAPTGPFLFRAFNCTTIPMPHIWPFDKVMFEWKEHSPHKGYLGSGFPSGDGTSDSPYIVANAKHLETMATLINTDVAGYNTAYYRMDEDIDLSGYANWEPIGNFTGLTRVFKGDFNGNGKKITNLTTQNRPNLGLFGVVYGAVYNLGIESGTINNQYLSAGGICGICYISGGLTGEIYGCYNKATITTTGDYVRAGGIAGANGGHIHDCYNTGSITSTASIPMNGGIVGQSIKNGTIVDCYNIGAVSVTNGTAFGGICGQLLDASSVTTSYYLDTSCTQGGTGSTALTTVQMQGVSAISNMTGFDFSTTWETGYSTYPMQSVFTSDIYQVYCTNSVFRLNGNTTIEGKGETTEKAKYAQLSTLTPTARSATSQSDVGTIVLNNNKPIWGKEATGGERISLIRMSAADNVVIGSTLQDGNTYINGAAEVKVYIAGNKVCTISAGSIVLNGICTIDSTGIKNAAGTYKVYW
jgi:hypothetical protein